MAEPQPRQDLSPDEGNPLLVTRLVPPRASSEPESADRLFQDQALELTDNTPTVITRSPVTALRAEEAIAGVLRGRHLAHFELLGPIGIGGMAAVLRARDTQLDRTVALKILPPEMASDPENVRRFHQEARAAAKLDHENIARVFFCGEDQGLHFIAFEFVEGENLSTMLERRGRIPVPEAVGYALQVATGLSHAAQRAVVHRDIKPSNIIITPTYRAKLVDMGLARSLEPHLDGGLTQSGVTLGTFDYISPEQALEPREADVRSDIYSLGCTLYHMITGQPSVPEGTAAKKLHHHQHIDPVDPRQLNPEVPDEVAALLARMMAKDAGQRYQRPEQLVRHLVALAKKYGVPADVPDSTMFAETPLPAAPRTRPMLVTAMAMLGLVILIFVVPWPPASRRPGHLREPASTAEFALPSEVKSAAPESSPPGTTKPEQTPATAPNSQTGVYKVQDIKGLAEHLRKHPETETVLLTEDLTLSHEDILIFADHNLTIRPAPSNTDAKPRRTIRLRYVPLPSKEPWFALTVKSGTVRIEDVRFEIDAKGASDMLMAAIEQQGGRLILSKCEFVQLHPPDNEQGRVSSIHVSGSGTSNETADLTLKGCYFAGGQYAVTISKATELHAQDCAFGRHSSALFHVQENTSSLPQAKTNLTLEKCSAFVMGNAVFRLDGKNSCQIDTKNCVFSRQEDVSSIPGSGALLVEAAAEVGELRYDGYHNCYHNLKAFLVEMLGQDMQKIVTDLATFRQQIGVTDKYSFELAQSPWESSDPLQALQDDGPRGAFRLNTTLPDLRRFIDKKKLMGVEECVWGASYDSGEIVGPEEKKPPESISRNEEKTIVLGDQFYWNLRQALEGIKPRDVIQIKKNGPVKVDPVLLEKASIDVTIRPYDGYHPILVIGDTTEYDAALFRIHDGHVTFENLEFRLSRPPADFKAQAIVALMGNGQCTLQNCVVTLGEMRGVPLSVAVLPDSSNIMRTGNQLTAQQIPRVSLRNCFVRGAGDLLTIRTSRACELEVVDSLVALDGSLLTVDGSGKDVANRENHTEVTLRQVTTYLTDHLVWLRANKDESKPNKGLVHTMIKTAANSLFVSATSKSLIHLDGVDTDDQMKHYFSWAESQHNAFSNFERLLDQQPGGDNPFMPPPPYGTAQWKDFTQDQGGRFDRSVRFNTPPAPDSALAKALPSNFKPKAEANWQGYGVDVERLPEPFDESPSRKPAADK